jgi:hypothetical protein
MALYVYVTEQCRADAEKYSRHKEMLALKNKVESTQRICHFDNFPPPYLKKRFDRQIRLLADYRPIRVGHETHLVVDFLRIFVRSSNEYSSFLSDTDAFGKKHLEPLVSDETLAEFLQEQLRVHPIAPKQAPSELEHHFLYRFLGQDQVQSADEFVCESERWVRSVEEKKLAAMLLHLSEALPELAGDTTGATSKTVRDCHIVYRWLPHLRKLFLAGIARDQQEMADLRRQYASIFDASPHEVSEELVLQNSMRTYPAFLLADEEAWMDIEKDKESNLALSPEETRVLESVHSNEGGFPIFINGRAGSGKSTILYYLFADYVSLYLELEGEENLLEPPLLLSCSNELKRRAHEVVGNLITYNPRWKRDGAEPVEVPSECFHEFRSFLRSKLTPQERAEFFPESKYVGYAQFRRMWDRQFGRDKKMKLLGADLSWHVIRTYIKGTHPEDYLEPEEYMHVPRKQRTVSEEAFQSVHDVVWTGWYREQCEQDGHWDDQDLARHIFATGRIKPSYPAVFCDEAQDFTRVELDLLFRMCVFADRSLSHTDISRVPFAFAGDPFQTLNPTGFRWDSIQALFHDKLVDTLGENVHRNVELNYQELELNYRSTKNIVRICNLVQAVRAAIFDIPKLQPQRTWQAESNSPMPVWFDRDRPQDWEVLQESQQSDVIIIVPCMLDEEQDFVQNDPKLREVVKVDELGVPVNVLSPTRAKGLEFGRVALYGFSEKSSADLLDLLDQDDYDGDRLLPFEYFVNQLYVAASRPKRRLFIIESQTGRDKLWKIANDESLQSKLWSRIHDGRATWADFIGGFVLGNADSWQEDRGNPEENAERFMQQGLATRDPYMLRSAAMLYENMGKTAKSHDCKAHALKIEGKVSEAGEFFQKAGKFDDALKCFWEAGTGAKDQMLELHRASPDIGTTIEFKLFSVYRERSIRAMLSIMEELTSRGSDDLGFQERLAEEKTFAELSNAFADEVKKSDASDDDVRRFLRLASTLSDFGVAIKSGYMAELHFRVGMHRQAVTLWESTENYAANPNYRRSKATLLAQNYEESTSIPLTELEGRLLGEYFAAEGKFLLAAKCLRAGGVLEHLMSMLAQVPSEHVDWQEILLELTEGLAVSGEWSQLIDLALLDTGKRRKVPSKELFRIVQSHAVEIRNAIAVTCALHIYEAPNSTQVLKSYSAYFNKVFSTPAQWRNHLTVRAAGAAMEFTGRQVDVLRFYESVTGDLSFPRDAKDFAWQRWILTKERQSKRESEHGNERAARRYMSEAEDKRKEFGWPEKFNEVPLVTLDAVWVKHEPARLKVPQGAVAAPEPATVGIVEQMVPVESAQEFSELIEPLPETSAIEVYSGVGPTNFSIGDLRFEYARERGRVNITHSLTMDTASIRSDQETMKSTDFDIRQEGSVFYCDAWGCTCSFNQNSHRQQAIFSIPRLDISLSLGFPELRNKA